MFSIKNEINLFLLNINNFINMNNKLEISFGINPWYNYFTFSEAKEILWLIYNYKDFFWFTWYRDDTYKEKTNYISKFNIDKLDSKKTLENWIRFDINNCKEEYISISFGNNFDKKTWYLYNPLKWMSWTIINDKNENNISTIVNYLKKVSEKYTPNSIYILPPDEMHSDIFDRRWENWKKDDLIIYWWAYFLTFLSNKWINRMKEWAREKLLKAPAYKAEELEWRWILIQHTESIFDYVWNNSEKVLESLEVLNDYIRELLPTWEERKKYIEQDDMELLNKKITFDYLLNN